MEGVTEADREAALLDALDGRLDPQELPGDLQEELAATARVLAELRALPEPEPPADFQARLERRLQLAAASAAGADSKRPVPAPSRRRAWARRALPWAGAVAAALVLAVAGYGIGVTRRPASATLTAASVAQPEFAARAVHAPAATTNAPFKAAGNAVFGASVSTAQAPAASAPAPLNVAQRKIVENASMTVRVADVGAAFNRLGTLTAASKGYVAQSNLYQGPGGLHASATLRVPSASLAAFTQKVGALGTVTAQGQGSNDVTQQYFDETGRLQALQAERTAYLGLLKKATNVADALKVQQALTDVEAQIETLTTEIQSLNNMTSLATVNVTLEPLSAGPTAGAGGGPFGGRLGAALGNSWRVLAAAAAGAAVAVVWAVPWLVLLAVVAGIVLAVVRLRRRSPRQPPAA